MILAWLEEATIAFYLQKLSTDMAAAAAAEVAQKLQCGAVLHSKVVAFGDDDERRGSGLDRWISELLATYSSALIAFQHFFAKTVNSRYLSSWIPVLFHCGNTN